MPHLILSLLIGLHRSIINMVFYLKDKTAFTIMSNVACINVPSQTPTHPKMAAAGIGSPTQHIQDGFRNILNVPAVSQVEGILARGRCESAL